jgi:hypothetical protein
MSDEIEWTSHFLFLRCSDSVTDVQLIIVSQMTLDSQLLDTKPGCQNNKAQQGWTTHDLTIQWIERRLGLCHMSTQLTHTCCQVSECTKLKLIPICISDDDMKHTNSCKSWDVSELQTYWLIPSLVVSNSIEKGWKRGEMHTRQMVFQLVAIAEIVLSCLMSDYVQKKWIQC